MTIPRRRTSVVVLLLAAVITLAIAVPRSDAQPTVRLAIAVNSSNDTDTPLLPASAGWPASQRIVHDWGVDQQFGLDLELVPRVTGQGALATLIDSNADAAFVAAPPLLRALAQGEELLILAETERSTAQIRHVVAAEHTDDWATYPIGVIPGTVIESAMLAELQLVGQIEAYQNGEVEVVGAENPSTMVNALLDGSIASAFMLQPHAALLTQAPDRSVTEAFRDITTPDRYRFVGFLVTTAAKWSSDRDAIIDTARAVNETRDLIAAEPDRRLQEIHNFESGETALRDVTPRFWSEDEIIFDTDPHQIAADLTTEAELMVTAGTLAAIPDLAPTLNALATVERHL